MRIRQDSVAGDFERGDRPVAPHGRELAEKFIERRSSLEVVEQGLDGHPRTCKNSGATQGPRIAVNYGGFIMHHTNSKTTGFIMQRNGAVWQRAPQDGFVSNEPTAYPLYWIGSNYLMQEAARSFHKALISKE